jgi:transcriptional regulator with XRE-family HTH domain
MSWGPYFESGDQLRQARIQANWTQKRLAILAGVHVQTVKYNERRKDQLDGVACSRFRKALAGSGKSLPELPKRRSAPIASRPMVEPSPVAVVTTKIQKGNISKTMQPKNGFKNQNKTTEPAPMRCGAITRKGSPCKAKAVSSRHRCKIHGGLSTGPKTPEGRSKVSAAQSRRWERFRLEKQSSESTGQIDIK